MENTNYMLRFVSENVITEAVKAYDTMVATRNSRSSILENEVAGAKFYGMRAEVAEAVPHAFDRYGSFGDTLSMEHQAVLFRMMARDARAKVYGDF